MAKVYDLVVIGGGSGGLECGWNTAELYKKNVVIIDQQKTHGPPYYSAIGGTCVNIGCVPKKLMVTGANYREALRDAKGFGWDVEIPAQGDWKKLMEGKNKAVLDINNGYEDLFSERLEFKEGFGRVKSPTCVELLDPATRAVTATLETKNIVIATGSWPFNPPFEGIEHTISSNEVFYLPEAPKNPLVVGGGFVAVEFSGIFNAYKPADGKVHLCYRGELFLRGFDKAIREQLLIQMRANGIDVQLNENPKKIELLPNGNRRVTMESGKVSEHDVVMYATGRHPKTAGMGLAEAGVELNAHGGVVIDKVNATKVPGIFAIGDVTDKIMLTPVAIHEGACLAARVFNDEADSIPDLTNVAAAVFSIPPIGTVGMLEENAAKKYANVAVHESSFLPLPHRLTGAEHKRCFYRIIVDADTKKILGVHMLGGEAPEIIQAIGICVKMGAKISDFYTTIGVHPTSAEELCSMRMPAYTYANGTRVTSSSSSL